MIQRIQTVYLSLAIVLQLLLFYFSTLYWEDTATGYQHIVTSVTVIKGDLQQVSLLVIPNIVAILLMIAAIFGYRKRMRQVKLCMAAMGFLFIYLLSALCLYLFSVHAETMVFFPERSWGLVIPVISAILTWMAIRNIRKDEALVRSADRIR